MTTLSGPVRPDLLRDELFHEIFIFTATRFPTKVAILWQDEQITYRQLHQQALQMARTLHRTKQIGPNNIVGIRLSRSAQLHVAILAVLMTGATYVPFDADTPQERVSEVLADLEAVLLLVDSHTSMDDPIALNIQTLNEDQMITEDDILPTDINANSAAYIICTSGSTGKPKSIAITHRSICHFVRSENEIMQIRYDDIVYQGISAAFDMFFEEAFLAYLVGATLVVASKSDVLNTDRLHLFFIRHSITVLCCVPTLLLLMTNDPALKVRLINTGGEACPKTLVDRWWKEDRLIFNSYGPSEATVTATAILLRPDEPISIGTPLPNYVCCLLDETTGQPTSANTGELCISGPGVALGYVRRDSLTKEKFTQYGYRTGDRVTFDNGRIFFHGRVDTQVKLRGFRIELDEIEQEMLRISDDIQSAAVIVEKEQLIAFIVGQLTESRMREALGKRLPRYMVPDRLIKLNEGMPRLISGKIDRKALIARVSEEDVKEKKATETVIEIGAQLPTGKDGDRYPLNIVLHAFQENFPYSRPTENDDFFRDLGGHSMIAALTVTRLREAFPEMAIQDLYECKTAVKLAERLAMRYNNNNPRINLVSTAKRIKPTRIRSVICSIVQAFVLVIIAGVASLEFLLPFIFFHQMFIRHYIGYAYLAAYGAFVLIHPFRFLLAIMLKWIVIGRYKEGDFPLWGTMYLRWWTVEQFKRVADPEALSDTPFMTMYYRFLGAKIGRNVHLGEIYCSAPDLLEVGEATSISSNVYIQTAFVEDYTLKFRRVCIENDVYIGGSCVLGEQTTLEKHSEMGDMSFLPPNTSIPSGEVWQGSPAVYCRQTSSLQYGSDSSDDKSASLFYTIMFLPITLLFIPLMYFIPMIPGLALLGNVIKAPTISWAPAIIVPTIVGILYTCLVVLEIILMNYLLVRNLKVGDYSTNSFVYIRKWIFDRLSGLALQVISSIYATLYMTPFLRALGMKIGHRCEVSTAMGMINSLVEVGDECFIADKVTLGDPLVHRGKLYLRKTIIGNRVFIGNSAVIADGVEIPDNCLIGCLSVVADGLKEGQSCLGSPAIILPKRAEASIDIPEVLTYHPPINLIVKRFCVDTLRVFLPQIIIVFQIVIALEIFAFSRDTIGLVLSALTLPFLYIIVFAIPSLLICIILKWSIIGTYKNNQYAMWTWFVWTSEFVTAMYERLAASFALEFLRGTFFLAPALRCLGVKIGRGCFLDTTDITEFDLVRIGDYAAVNADVGLQTHLFEDRVMKTAEVFVEDDTNIGCVSIMLPNTRLGRGAKLGPLSLVIKGEGLPAETSWQGILIRADGTGNNRTYGSI